MRTTRRALLCTTLLSLLLSTVGSAGGGPKNVLLVINEDSPISCSIGAYYQQARSIPERNVCRIHCATAELVSKDECENNIVAPIRTFIETTGIHNRIDYIVLTKGIPLMASYNNSGWSGPASVSSVLTCVGEPSIIAPLANPYGPTAYPPGPDQYFTHQLAFSGRSHYVVTRLDAYTEEQAKRMIDDALVAQPNEGLFILDGRYEFQTWSLYYKANDRLRQANTSLDVNYTTYYNQTTFDTMIYDFVGGQQGVMGYFGWGSNEASYTLAAYTSNQFVPGSIADSYVSTSGRTFTYPPTYGQSLIADLIPQGLSAGTGYVSEPTVSLISYPNVLFDRYVRGYNMGESFFAAAPRLYWKAVTVGDPLMAPYATPPSVSITIQHPSPVHGRVIVSAAASDTSGVNKVMFFVDDQLARTCFVPPYQFEWDTMAASDGTHLIEAIAYENTSVYTQGMASVTAQVCNAPTDVAAISQLDDMAVGSLVRLTAKPVIAGTNAFNDCIYISEPDRSAGMKIIGVEQVPTGSIITVTGELSVSEEERVIVADSWSIACQPATKKLSETDPSDISPLAMPNRYVGNGSATGQESELIYGLANVGLLVRTWGRVVSQGTDEFAISDGSLDFNNPGFRDVTISLKNLAEPVEMPPLNSFVGITGVSCYTLHDGVLKQTIRPRSSADIVVTQ